jgi:hypothetical protein
MVVNIINSDGTMSKIPDWKDLTEIEPLSTMKAPHPMFNCKCRGSRLQSSELYLSKFQSAIYLRTGELPARLFV